MKKLGLIGYPLGHSFSKRYFTEKFKTESITNFEYELYPIENIEQFTDLLRDNQDLIGLNITIPYKQAIIPYLDEIDAEAQEVGAVNCITIQNGKLKGYNTDIYGFEKSLLDFIENTNYENLKALILGTGGSSKAVAYILQKYSIPFQIVSRIPKNECITYKELDKNCIENHRLIVNTTPIGMSPNILEFPDLPYDALGEDHYLYDLVYNPELTQFMKLGARYGANVLNGLPMLHLQAEKGWEIWNK
jgi:shikimate dehydrogenase